MATRCQYKQATLTRKIYGMVGRPSPTNFKHMVQMKLLPRCPITVDDVKNTDFLFGPDVGALKGKTTRTSPDLVVSNYIDIPPDLQALHHN
eukprot:6915405-Ditylum_brightwellii.AAC.1